MFSRPAHAQNHQDTRIANWVFGMVVDVAITAVLCWYMWSEKTYVRRK